MTSDSSKEMFFPTVRWMEEKFDLLNGLFFEGKLKRPDFIIFYRGIRKTAVTKYARGYFSCLGKCTIALNGNYKSTEKSWMTTLAHEMCHYYVFIRYGRTPIAHGKEFKAVCNKVNSMHSSVKLIYKLGIYASVEQRCESVLVGLKKKNLEYFVIETNLPSKPIMLITTLHKNIIERCLKRVKALGIYIGSYYIEDETLKERLFEIGYRINIRSVRWYRLEKGFFETLKRNY